MQTSWQNTTKIQDFFWLFLMDVFFVEEDGIVLLDYKTDAVKSMEELWNRYETQLTYYSEALQKLLQKPVKERLLYSFRLNTYE